MPDTQMKQKRKLAARRRRRIIFNHDGGDFPYCREATVEEVLRINMTGLAGSQVDSFFLSTSAAGCDMYSHNTKVAHVYEDGAGVIKGLIDRERTYYRSWSSTVTPTAWRFSHRIASTMSMTPGSADKRRNGSEAILNMSWA